MTYSGNVTLIDQGKSRLPTDNSTSWILGVAFLLQAATSLIGGLILKVALIVPGNINQSISNIANHTWLLKANILGEMITAAGVIFLGAVLFVVLRERNEKTALVALGFYVLEAALLAFAGERRIGIDSAEAPPAGGLKCQPTPTTVSPS
jgi:hypothetical protein